MNIVIKAHSFSVNERWIPVCKLSDDKGKESGDPLAIAQAKAELGLI